MDFLGFHKLFTAWTEGGRFGEPIMTITEILALTICAFYSTKTKIGKFFFTYILIDLTIGFIDYYLKYFSQIPTKKSNEFIHISNVFISAVELGTYTYFFAHILQKRLTRQITYYLLLVFALIFVISILSVNGDSYGEVAGFIGAIEFLFLLFPCITYYFELFTETASEDLLKRPSFWIVTGIFFYSAISIPYYLIDNFLQQNKYHFRMQLSVFMFYIPFSFNFLFLTKAFLCKKALTI